MPESYYHSLTTSKLHLSLCRFTQDGYQCTTKTGAKKNAPPSLSFQAAALRIPNLEGEKWTLSGTKTVLPWPGGKRDHILALSNHIHTAQSHHPTSNWDIHGHSSEATTLFSQNSQATPLWKDDMCWKQTPPRDKFKRLINITGRRIALYLRATSSQCHPTPEMKKEQAAQGVRTLTASNKPGTVWEKNKYKCEPRIRQTMLLFLSDWQFPTVSQMHVAYYFPQK